MSITQDIIATHNERTSEDYILLIISSWNNKTNSSYPFPWAPELLPCQHSDRCVMREHGAWVPSQRTSANLCCRWLHDWWHCDDNVSALAWKKWPSPHQLHLDVLKGTGALMGMKGSDLICGGEINKRVYTSDVLVLIYGDWGVDVERNGTWWCQADFGDGVPRVPGVRLTGGLWGWGEGYPVMLGSL